MTATDVGISGGNEDRRLKQLSFKVIDSKIQPSFNPAEELETVTEDQFLDCTKSNRARLIWCKDEQT